MGRVTAMICHFKRVILQVIQIGFGVAFPKYNALDADAFHAALWDNPVSASSL
jgi:hypothetical protein